MEIINDVLPNTQLKRRVITEGILSLPQIQSVTHEELTTQVRVLGAEYPEFVQPKEEHNRFMAQSKSWRIVQSLRMHLLTKYILYCPQLTYKLLVNDVLQCKSLCFGVQFSVYQNKNKCSDMRRDFVG